MLRYWWLPFFLLGLLLTFLTTSLPACEAIVLQSVPCGALNTVTAAEFTGSHLLLCPNPTSTSSCIVGFLTLQILYLVVMHWSLLSHNAPKFVTFCLQFSSSSLHKQSTQQNYNRPLITGPV